MLITHTLHMKFKTKSTVFSTDSPNTKICHVFNARMPLRKDKAAPVLSLACEWVSCQLHASTTLPPWGKNSQYLPVPNKSNGHGGPHSGSEKKNVSCSTWKRTMIPQTGQ